MIMKFIEALKLKSKLFLLFIAITLGLVVLGMMGRVNIQNMKTQIDGLYFGTLVPVTELNEILYQYNAILAPTIYKTKYQLLPQEELQENISVALRKIKTLWKSYKHHYKTQEELPYVNYTSLELDKTNQYFQQLLIALETKRNNAKNISLRTLENYLNHINQVIRKLLHYEMDVAKYNRKQFRQSYSVMIKNLMIILPLIILGVLFVTYYVFRSIQKEHTKLEKATKELQKVNKQLENVSYTDSLTGLHNRRYFNDIYEREVKRAKRDKKYITFMMIDIDFFKQYNDTYGHIAGDHALQIVAKTIKSCFKRPSDFVFRLGGEEFGVLIIDTDELSSARLAKELIKKVQAQQIEHKTSKVADVITVSVGVMSCVADESLESEFLWQRADKMLYSAKEHGRNRYMIASDIFEDISNIA